MSDIEENIVEPKEENIVENQQKSNSDDTNKEKGEENEIKIKSEENISKYIHMLFEIGALSLSDQHNEILKAFRQKYSCLPSPIRRALYRDVKYLLLFS
tara:strand:+ start:1236 stop:1532 length:297 start_codon:yes stop_codon:yes gene_type:complete